MDLASGYSDSINYGNGYTPLATGAINNNNADYLRNQAAIALMAQQAQNNVFASGGGFGQQTADYAGAGAAYGRATGGFTGGGGYPSGDVQRGPDLPNISQTPDPFAGMSGADMATWSRAMQSAGRGGEIPTSFADRFSAAPAIDYRLQPTPAQQLPQGIYDGVFAPTTPRPVTGTPQPEQPHPATGVSNPYSSMPWWNTFASAAGPQGVADWLQSQGVGGIGGNANTYGYPASGFIGGQDAFAGQPQQTPSGQGGIGSDRDPYGWMYAQQSPYATPQNAPANGPYPNLGYNPGMSNYFANPSMQQYDWTANNAKLQQQMQDALKTIDQSTGRQPEQPYGGQLPDFWQGVRDWTGMGPAQPTPTRDTWTNAS